MPETRCIETKMPDGSIVLEDCIEVSDEELYQEQLAQEMNDIHDQGITIYKAAGVALANWDSLTITQQKEVLRKSVMAIRGLIKWVLFKDDYLHLDTLED